MIMPLTYTKQLRVLNTVMCCSGCLAGYRRNTIEPFIPYWIKAKIQNSDDRELTTYVYAPAWGKTQLLSLFQIK